MFQIVGKFATRDIFEQEVKLVLLLEVEEELDNIGMAQP
jgi:hypothetical protein